jgi:hypothetical protein
MGEKRGANRVLVGRPEGRRSSGRYKHRWDGNIKMDLQEIGLESVDWIDLAQLWILVCMVINLLVSVICGEFLG